MLKDTNAFSGFSVTNLDEAEKFYGETLGLDVDRDGMGLHLKLKSGAQVFVYDKDNHTPASFTILNFPVDDVEKAVRDLKDKGVQFEHYEGMTDEDDIARGSDEHPGPDIAWFTDPAGNILSVLHNK